MKNKVCIVTGGNSGIGLVTAKELARQGATTVLVARDPQRGEDARAEIQQHAKNENVDLLLCDFSSQRSIKRFTEEFKQNYDRLDVLVNNAGLMSGHRQETETGLELTFAVNHLGYFSTTNHLLDMLEERPGSRIVVVASDAHFNGKIDMSNLMHVHDYHGFGAYSDSKLANILFTYKLADRLKGKQLTVNAVHPGVIKTKFGVHDRNSNNTFAMGMISPEDGARAQIYLSTSDEVTGVSGRYFNQMRPEPSSPMSYDMNLAAELWDKSEQLVTKNYG